MYSLLLGRECRRNILKLEEDKYSAFNDIKSLSANICVTLSSAIALVYCNFEMV